MFQARHLNRIAATILAMKPSLRPEDYTLVAIKFTKMLEASPGFDPVRFLKACGWEEDTATLVFDKKPGPREVKFHTAAELINGGMIKP